MKTTNCILHSVLILIFVTAAAIGQDGSELRKAASNEFGAGNYTQAAKLLDQYLRSNSKDDEGWNMLGVAYLKTGEATEARKAIQKAVKLKPENSLYRVNLAQAYLSNNDPFSALKEGERAVKLDPKNRDAYVARGSAFFQQGKHKQAIQDADSAIKADKSYLTAYILKANALLHSIDGTKTDKLRAEQRALLQEGLDALRICKVECDKNIGINILAETTDSLEAFIDFFSKEIPDANEKPDVPANTISVKMIAQPKPPYTTEARQAGITGTIKLAVLFSADRSIGHMITLNGLPNGLTERAVGAARQIVFEPQIVDGKAVSKVKVIQYSFSLY